MNCLKNSLNWRQEEEEEDEEEASRAEGPNFLFIHSPGLSIFDKVTF